MTDRLGLRTLVFTATLLAVSVGLSAQGAGTPAGPAPKPAATPAQAPAPAQPPATAPGAVPAGAPATALPPTGEPYTYNPENRRDPFVSLILRGLEAPSGKRSEGLGGLSTAELQVKGVLLSKGSYLALVQGADGKNYAARVNDRLADGTIRSITPQGMVIMQEVNDPLSLIKQKEVRKGLRASDDGKQ